MKPSNATFYSNARNTIPRSSTTAFAPARAFTRVELLAVVIALGLLAATVLPMLAGSKRVSERVSCVSNLERIGQATHAWMGDHGDEQLPLFLSMADGGIYRHPLRQNAYLSFVILSNYLDTPRHLVCPADEETFGAPDWALFDTPLYRANALSYFIGTDTFMFLPKTLLAGDRHFPSGTFENCPNGGGVRAVVLLRGDTNVRWNAQTIHGESGNILCTDGQVVQTSSAGLRTLLNNQLFGDLNGSNHLLPPR